MSAPTAVDGYPPDHYARHYARRVWPLGEGCDEGCLVEGDDRRSVAAASAYCRGEDVERPTVVEVRWVETFATACGCTAEQHAGHDYCERDGCGGPNLPPCGDQFVGG